MTWVHAGRGTATGYPDPVEGVLVEITSPEDVLATLDRIGGPEWEPPIALVHEAGGTTLGPLLGDLAGVVSTTGTLGSHIALLAKEYGCACIVGAQLDLPAAAIRRARMAPDGSVAAQTRE